MNKEIKQLIKENKFFSVYSIAALKSNDFAIIHGNIESTEEKYLKALELYPEEHYFIQFHVSKENMRAVN